MSEQMNTHYHLGTRFYNFQSPISTLSPQRLKLKFLVHWLLMSQFCAHSILGELT